MSTLAVIPARGGSKGLPGKNLAEINGVSLVARAVNVARESGVIDDVVVTSDDHEILNAAKTAGAITVERPSALATDTARIEDAIIHALEQYSLSHPTPEVLVLLQTTSPLRQPSTISDAINMFRTHELVGSIYGVVECEHHPYKAFIAKGDHLVPVSETEYLSLPRQNLPKAFRQSGSIYVVSVRSFLEHKSLLVNPVRPIEVSQEEAIDIDSMADLEIARQVANHPNA